MSNKSNGVRIAIFAVVLIGLVFIMRIVAKAAQTSGKYDSFAQCLVTNGVHFYGAFWCPHCQQQEQWLDASRQKLQSIGLYNECSLPSGNGQDQACNDKQIEGYPTWIYDKGFTITTKTDPTICPVQPGPSGQPAACASYGSSIFKTWIFNDVDVRAQSAQDPAHSGDTWTFAAGSRTSGELPVTELSALSSCQLPTATK